MDWTWANATCRGTSHISSGTPCQDYARCLALGPDSSVLVAVVSDGAGSASLGRAGAALACRTVVAGVRAHFSVQPDQPSDEIIWSWIDNARDWINFAASRRYLRARDFAATLVCVIATRAYTLVLHIGDGAAVLKFDDGWMVPSWPEAGEFASSTYFITDDPAPRLSISRIEARADAIAVFSDGIERLALNFGTQQPHLPFFDAMLRPVSTGPHGHNEPLSRSLATYLDSEKVNERTNDDKSLILAARVR